MSGSEINLRAVVFRRSERSQQAGVDNVAGAIQQTLEEVYAGEYIELVSSLSQSLDGLRVQQYNFSTSIAPAPRVLPRHVLAKLEASFDADIIVHHAHSSPRKIELAVFDMDSTLIRQEVIDLLAGYAGVEAQVADITARAMNGELDFSGSLKERVGLLKGLSEGIFDQVKPQLTLTPGADVLLKVLKKQGAATALLSGGFTPLATFIAERLGIDHVYANDLEAKDGKLSGQLTEDCKIVNAERKRSLLLAIAKQEGITRQADILAVGDGANDLLMLSAAGLGIAVNAKPHVQDTAPYKLDCPSLTDVLHVLGYTREQIEEMTRGE